jgi:hypothetical protein
MMMMRDQKNTHQKKPVRLLVESFAKTGSGQTQLVAAEKVCRDIQQEEEELLFNFLCLVFVSHRATSQCSP